jgi:hypothetical protein
MPGARIHDNERPECRVNRYSFWRHDPDKSVVDRPIEPPAVDQEFNLEIQNVRRCLRSVLAVIIAALAQRIQE